jgi:hypothetical protein
MMVFCQLHISNGKITAHNKLERMPKEAITSKLPQVPEKDKKNPDPRWPFLMHIFKPTISKLSS